MTLTLTFVLKIAFLDFVAARGIVSVSQTPLDFILYKQYTIIGYFTSLGGPGSGKGTQCKKILERYKNFVHLSMGDIIRKEIASKGTVDQKWGMISTLVQQGEMAPEVSPSVCPFHLTTQKWQMISIDSLMLQA